MTTGELIDLATGGTIVTAGTIATLDTQNQYLLDDGTTVGPNNDPQPVVDISSKLTLYSGNTYLFDLETVCFWSPICVVRDPDGIHTTYTQNSVTLNTNSATINVTDTTNILVGMPVAVTSGTGTLDAATVVQSVDNATTITLSVAPLVNGTANLSFTGYEYTTGVVKTGNITLKVTDTTPDLYYYCGTHSGMGGTSPNFDVLPSDTNN